VGWGGGICKSWMMRIDVISIIFIIVSIIFKLVEFPNRFFVKVFIFEEMLVLFDDLFILVDRDDLFIIF
jgi:hypothetical protein